MKVKELLEKLKNTDLEYDIVVGEIGQGEERALELKEVFVIPREVILGY